jgi:RNA polymerase sigma-70 factor (ECF subfamily)
MKLDNELVALKRYALSLTRHHSEADDLVHDTLLRAYERRSTFDETRSVRAWLFAIMHNLFIDAKRRRRAETAYQRDRATAFERHGEATQESAVRVSQLTRAFAKLSDDQRAVLHLVVVEGLSYLEVGEALDIPVGTVMSRLARARAALRAFEEGEPMMAQVATLRIVGGRDDQPK